MPTLHAIPVSERPRERLLQEGPQALSLRECIAVLLGSGTQQRNCLEIASDILDFFGPGLEIRLQERAFFNALEGRSTQLLQSLHGIGNARQAALLAAFEIGRRFHELRTLERTLQPCSSNTFLKACQAVPTELRLARQEWIGFVTVGPGQYDQSFVLVEKGVRTHVNFDPADLFGQILTLRPQGFYLFHNHPSGSLTPSPEDLNLTQQVAQIANALGVRLYGHGIVSSEGQTLIPNKREENSQDIG